MKKALTLLIMLLVFSNAAAQCSDRVACKNQEGMLYCLPEDTECVHIRYIDWQGACIPDASFLDTDIDGDGWTDKCDAFPYNSSEWMDIDGDGLGYNKDCDDFDASIVCPPSEKPQEKAASPKNAMGGSLRVYCTAEWECTEWSECIEGMRTRSCVKTNICENDLGKPDEEWGCPLVTELSSDEKVTSEPATETNLTEASQKQKGIVEEKKKSLPTITGQAFLDIEKINPFGLLLLLLAVSLVLFFYVKKKRRESAVVA